MVSKFSRPKSIIKMIEDLEIQEIYTFDYNSVKTHYHIFDSPNSITSTSSLEEEIVLTIYLSKTKEDLIEYLLDDNLLTRKIAAYKLKELEKIKLEDR